jgi:L-seryl-tRNA(Ser) seleniumtransferase
MRAFRLDKMTLAALEATLRLYLHEERALRDVPVLRMLGLPLTQLYQRAEALATRLRELDGLATVTTREDVAFVGGGSLPDQAMKTYVVEIKARGLTDDELAHHLRTGSPAVVGRLRERKLVLDLRTVSPDEEDRLVEAVRQCLCRGMEDRGWRMEDGG